MRWLMMLRKLLEKTGRFGDPAGFDPAIKRL